MRLVLLALLALGCGSDRRSTGGGSGGPGGDPGAGAGQAGAGEGGEGEAVPVEGEGEGEGEAGGAGGDPGGGDPGGGDPGGGGPGGPPDDEWPEICRDLPARVPQPEIDLSAGCRRGGDPLRIKDLRDSRCPDYEQLATRFPGRPVVLEEAIVTGVFGNDFTVRDPEGGAYSALWVYDAGPEAAEVQVGDRVRLEGTVIEFFSLTEMGLQGENGGLQILGRGNGPDPVFIADPHRIATGGDLVEQLESQIVEIRNVEVTNTAPDCPQEHHMFEVTMGLRVANDEPPNFGYEAARGDVLIKVVGAVHYSFDHNKLLPRGDADIALVRCGGIPDKCEATECPVPEDAPESGRLIITEIQDNPEGDDQSREFVEVYNPGPDAIVLDGWSVRDCSERGVALQGRLAAGRYHVIAASDDPDENGGLDADGLMGDLFLPNGFGEVLVYDPDGALSDQVRYRVGEGWPERQGGRSLELPEPAADNMSGGSWRAGQERYGDGGRGSPGEAAPR